MVLAPRTFGRLRFACFSFERTASRIDLKSNPVWNGKNWSSAAITATAACGEICSRSRHRKSVWYRSLPARDASSAASSMNALYHGSIQRIATTGSAVTRNAATAAMESHRSNRRPNPFFTPCVSPS
jgi:hypothetical protein